MKNKTTLLYISIFLSVLGLDIWTKRYFSNALELGQSQEVIPNFFSFTLVHNPGAAFGMFGNLAQPWRGIILCGVVFVACYFLNKIRVSVQSSSISSAAVYMILGGAVGNLIDRASMGYVVDFLDVYVGETHWPAFNVADSAICIGVGLLMLFGDMAGKSKSS